MTTTDMVRCRSLVEQTRMLMVEIMSQSRGEEDDDDEDDDTDEDTDADDGATTSSAGAGQFKWNLDEDRLHMDAARVYENTIIHLGDRMGDAGFPNK